MADDDGFGSGRPVAVAIGGFLCRGPSASVSFWGILRAALHAQGFRVIMASPSPVGSLHDRACQIFYELKGGTVCYGQEHSLAHGHACHGETLVGKFPAWGEDRPIHIVGHSYGGQTARVLQHLVATGFFSKPGEYTTNAGWVRSVTACNSPLNGSLLLYSMGEKSQSAPAVRLGSIGHLLSVAIHVVELLDWACLRRAFDPRLSHFRLSLKHLGLRRGFVELWRALIANSRVFMTTDNAAFDMTVHSASQWNRIIETDPRTFYFSITGLRPYSSPRSHRRGMSLFCKRGSDDPDGDVASPESEPERECWKSRVLYSTLQWLHGWQVRAHEQTVERLFGVFPESWSWIGHDGVLEAFTQSHPRVPMDCKSAISIGFPRHLSSMKPGVWHSVSMAVDHLWVHVDGDEARAVLGRLARNLRMIAESHADGPARRTRSTSNPSRLRLRHASSPCRKSPQRDYHPRPKAMGENEETRGPQQVASGYGGEGSFSPLQAFSTIRDGGRVRCDVCSRGHECYAAGIMKGGEIARGATGDDVVCSSSSEATPHERCHVLWLSLVFVFVALVSGMAVSFWLAEPGRLWPSTRDYFAVEVCSPSVEGVKEVIGCEAPG